MYLLIDSREKPKAINGILHHFAKNNVKYDVTKLYFGDYMNYAKPNRVIDRKHNIAELAINCTRDRKRFKRELERVKATGSELILLVEQNSFKDREQTISVETIEDLMLWTAPKGVVRGEQVYRVLVSWCHKYPLRVEFCHKRDTGKRILELLEEQDE
nr:MAG TPA: ATP-dependent RNA helicase [Caudoviricetes sp.]